MSQQPFQKFINAKNNAAIKEKHKQEKKKAKKERAAAIEKHFEEKRAARQQAFQKKTATENKPARREKFQQPKIKKGDKSAFTGAAVTSSTVSAEMPLNKFLAHCGITSRRDAVQLIIDGKVQVNKNSLP